MSGGSFNYLCHAGDLEDLIAKRHHLDEMATTLAHLGYAADAAQETASLLAHIRSTNARAEASTDRLSGVWKAVEWWHSADRGEDAVHQALAKYRGETHTPRTTYQLTADEAAVVDALRTTRDKEPNP